MSSGAAVPTSSATVPASYSAASDDEKASCYDMISQSTKKPAILKIVMPYAEAFVPVLATQKFPISITELYDSETLLLSYPQLLKKCEEVFHSINVCYKFVHIVYLLPRNFYR